MPAALSTDLLEKMDAYTRAANYMARFEDVDIDLSINGRVMEVLSEHVCEGWLEGYLLTGRHGLFSCYEARFFIWRSRIGSNCGSLLGPSAPLFSL
jgi:phosphoketolase